MPDYRLDTDIYAINYNQCQFNDKNNNRSDHRLTNQLCIALVSRWYEGDQPYTDFNLYQYMYILSTLFVLYYYILLFS